MSSSHEESRAVRRMLLARIPLPRNRRHWLDALKQLQAFYAARSAYHQSRQRGTGDHSLYVRRMLGAIGELDRLGFTGPGVPMPTLEEWAAFDPETATPETVGEDEPTPC